MLSRNAKDIAVVDDDRRVLNSLANLLASCGYETQLFISAELFLAADMSDFLCVITDLGMRPIDGLDVLRRVRSRPDALPVIVITGKPGDRPESFYLDHGAVGFFRKPVDGDALIALIDQLR
ncbi:response regulator receiver protein [Cupriavidus basilensis OR16]|uniref:Response regulator receiver protein n=1 Tax=Cupriavidus basilensis OR16 TaxID=1127483 RepID=H1S248_9BURK|nr:response regulator [Cupriavidus basilensis]EHP43414.1 response regulator receiver protein [Cupriavidus basilensis OR16]